jgi:fructose-bisphosphate aldolase/2-amino-3,7-dideoxy-D-threo-hept-6-ulosonate synthase
MIKTHYTGRPDSFKKVVEACSGVPVLAAGGPAVSATAMLQIASEVLAAGGAGICFGRNVFSRDDPRAYLSALSAIVRTNYSLDDAIAHFYSFARSEPTDA